MKSASKFLFPVTMGVVCAVIVCLYYMEYLPYEMIPGAPFDLSIIPMMAIFWAVYFILKRNVFEPIVVVLQKREEIRSAAETEYRDADDRIQAMTREWEDKIRAVREEFHSRREDLLGRLAAKRAEKLQKAREEARRKMDEAFARVDAECEKARSDLEAYSRELASRFVEKILGRKVA